MIYYYKYIFFAILLLKDFKYNLAIKNKLEFLILKDCIQCIYK